MSTFFYWSAMGAQFVIVGLIVWYVLTGVGTELTLWGKDFGTEVRKVGIWLCAKAQGTYQLVRKKLT